MCAPISLSLAIYMLQLMRKKQQPAPPRRSNFAQPALNIHTNRLDINSSVTDGIEEVYEERKVLFNCF